MIKYFFISFLGATLLLSCGGSDQTKTPEVSGVAKIIEDTLSHTQDTTPTADTTNNWKVGKYFCPMKCEGEKMYDKAGQCPECGMDLRVWRATATN